MATPAQIKAARALLGWTQAQLADAAGLSAPTIKRLELEHMGVSDATMFKVQDTLEAAGVEFLGLAGVTLKRRRK